MWKLEMLLLEIHKTCLGPRGSRKILLLEFLLLIC